MVEKQVELVDDIITFFQKFGASNELSNRNFDTGDFFSEEYCNFVLDLAKKYGVELTKIGKSGGDEFVLNDIKISLKDLQDIYFSEFATIIKSED